MKDIGKNIKSIRQTKGMTQDALAEALFVTRQTVSNYENGRSRPDLDMLLKIAQVLDTDINAIIYGPSIPQSKKNGYRWLAISGSALVAMTMLYALLSILFSKESGAFYYEYISLRWINRLTLFPAMLFVLGWVLTHCLSLFANLRQLRPERSKVLRVIACVLLGLLVIVPVPYIVFQSVALYRSIVYHNVSMTFPYIPVLWESFKAILFLVRDAPFAYIILGGVFWLLALPDVGKREESVTG